ncbi:carboxyl transferase domain-containing protein [Streptomyces sp. NPDC005562]|uniref:acyl-CoA carboxylase subunit beta n=1 Tax=Streptomyces sp. NPDC005562 TaxID=3154890 RepID=UPI0033A7578A
MADGGREMAHRVADLDRVKAALVEGSGAPGSRAGFGARDRVDLLLDEGSFVETHPLRRHRDPRCASAAAPEDADGVVTGWGTVQGRTTFVYALDSRGTGSGLGETHAEKIHKVMDLAERAGAPLVSLCEGSGAHLLEGAASLARYGGILRRAARASGVVPQIGVVLGPCEGAAAYAPLLGDFVFVVRGTVAAAGGAGLPEAEARTASFLFEDEESCLAGVRRLLSFLPANNRELPPLDASDDPVGQSNDPVSRNANRSRSRSRSSERLREIVPREPGRPYDIHEVIGEIVDDGAYMEVHEGWGSGFVCAFARLGGEAVGVVADQPRSERGAPDAEGLRKAAGFVTVCDAFNIPLVTLVDAPDFVAGSPREAGELIRHGAGLLYAYGNATVPRISVVLRKAHGAAYLMRDSRAIGTDLALAWPTNEIAVTDAETAVDVAFRRDLAESDDPQITRERLVKQYTARFLHPYYGAEDGLVDDVIDPAATRGILVAALATLRTKQEDPPSRKHGNPPL